MGKRLIIYLFLITVFFLPQTLFCADSGEAVLKFSASQSEQDLNGVSAYNTTEKEGVIKTSWLNENTLAAECFITTYCGGVEITGNFEIKDDSLILKYNRKVGDEVTRCIGFRRLNYEISNLPKKDYKIIFKEENALGGKE